MDIEHGWLCYEKRSSAVIVARWTFRFVTVANRVLPLPPGGGGGGVSCFPSSSALRQSGFGFLLFL